MSKTHLTGSATLMHGNNLDNYLVGNDGDNLLTGGAGDATCMAGRGRCAECLFGRSKFRRGERILKKRMAA